MSEFLIELSIGVHRYAMYPPDHPSLEPAVVGIMNRLGELFRERTSLSIGVARKQLVIEGVATDERHPVLSDLARRLHDHHLGAVAFESGVRGEEVQGLLNTLAAEVEPDETPLGLRDAELLPAWGHIAVYPVGYDRLTIRDEEEGEVVTHDRAGQLWLGLAQAALAGGDGDADELDPERDADPRTIARSIREHRREKAYDQVIVGYMLQLAQELKSERGSEAATVRRRVTELVREMDEATLGRLVDMGGDTEARRRLVLDANESLAVDAVVKLLKAAAAASQQTVSTSMTRLLTKLAAHADEGPPRVKTQAGSALRENVQELISGWELDDPNPDQYTRILDSMAQAAPIFQERSRAGLEGPANEIPGPMRILQMALEVDAYGATVEAALLDLVSMGYSAEVFRLVRDAPADSQLARQVLRELTHPAHVSRYLAGQDVDDAALAALQEQMGDAAIDVFLDGLAESESRSVRRKVFDRLRQMGPKVGEAVVERLRDEERWYVLRNWLALLQHMPEVSAGFDAFSHLQHDDPRVRREALPLVLARPDQRARGLALALADADDRVCRAALGALGGSAPEALVPTIVNRVVKGRDDETLQKAGIRALADAPSPLVRETLLQLVMGGRTLLGKPKLADPGPVMAEALSVLRRLWPEDSAVRAVLGLASRSRDASVRAAARGEISS